MLCVQLALRGVVELSALAAAGGAPREAAAAAALRVIHVLGHVLGRLGPAALEPMLSGYPVPGREERDGYPLGGDAGLVFAAIVEIDVLGPALTAGEAPAVNGLAGIAASLGGTGQAVAARLAAMAEAAYGVDSADVGAATARAEVLGGGGECAFQGCRVSAPPLPDGAPQKKKRICSSCKVARYCGPSCSKADWKVHRVACRAFQAERGEAAS